MFNKMREAVSKSKHFVCIHLDEDRSKRQNTTEDNDDTRLHKP